MKQLLCALALAIACATTAQAADFTIGNITISGPWIRATPGKVPNGAGYLTLHNQGADDRIVSISSTVSPRAELHTHIADGDIMRMRRLEDGLELASGSTVMLAPHGHHIMLMGLKAPLKAGDTVDLTLTFEKAGKLTIDVPVMPLGFKGMAGDGGMGHGGMQGHDAKQGMSGDTMKGHDMKGHKMKSE